MKEMKGAKKSGGERERAVSVVVVVIGRKEDSLKSVADGGNFQRH